MKSRKLWVGIPLIILVFAVVLGVVLTSCDQLVEENLLIGGWYKTQAAADAGGTAPIEFTSDSRLKIVSGTSTNYYQYESSGSSLTIKSQSGSQVLGDTTFTVTETELTLQKAVGPLAQKNYYRKATSSGGGDPNQPPVDDTKAATPEAVPPGATYTTTQSVSLYTDTVGADIYYTTTGTDPTLANGIKYTSAIPISATTTLKAIAIKDGLDDSDIMTQVYTITSATPITVAQPTASPAAGSFTSTQSVTLTAEAGAVIYYTITGTDLTATTGTVYSSPISIGTTTTLRAIAVINGVSSTEFSGTYTITPPVAPPTQTAITVTNGNSSGAGSLRQALIDIANNGTITIASTVTVINLASELTIGSSIAAGTITIEGNGVILQPTYSTTAGQSLILVTGTHAVNIRRVHFKNGTDTTTSAGNGAAIYNSGSLDINSCIFSINGARNGGALYNNAGNATLRGCTFYNNSATNSGGAIYLNTGTVTIVGNIFYGNTAPGTAKTSGPIVYKAGGTLTSYGYNVVDIPFGSGNNQCGWTAYNNDKTLTDLGISSPFVSTTTFSPVIGLASFIPSLPVSFPTTYFDGSPRETSCSPGAVK